MPTRDPSCTQNCCKMDVGNKASSDFGQQVLCTSASTKAAMPSSSVQASLQHSTFLDLPAELYSYFALDIAVHVDLESTFNLSRTCRSLYNSSAGQSVRYLWALRKHNSPAQKQLPRPLGSLTIEADRILRCSWPPEDYAEPERVWRLVGSGQDAHPLTEMDLTTLIIDGVSVAGLTRDGNAFVHLVTEALSDHTRDQVHEIASYQPHSPISAFDVDFDEGVAVLGTTQKMGVASEKNVADAILYDCTIEDTTQSQVVYFQVIDIYTGKPKATSGIIMVEDIEPDQFQVEILGPYVLIQAGGHISIDRWRADGSESPTILKKDHHVWRRDKAASVFPVLTAHMLGLDTVVVLSTPTSSEHGLDWGSTMEFYRFTQSHAPRVADVQLPIRAKPVRGQSYIKTGLGKRLRAPSDNGLIVVCVEGFVWVADLEPFLELLFPQNALSLFGTGHPTLDSHWVRAHMHKCSLASLDATPLRPVAVNGWRIAAVWSRDYSPLHPESPSGRKHATYVRFLQADPRYRQEPSKITGRDQRPDQQEKPPVHTMFVPSRFYSYCDHDISRYIHNLSPGHTLVHLDGARLLLTSPTDTTLVFT